MINSLGVNGLQVEEIYSLEDRSLYEALEPIYGLIFLFKFDTELYKADQRNTISSDSLPNVFYAKQVVSNACATQAILHVLLNLPSTKPIGELLTRFKQDVLPLDSGLRGEAIGQNNDIRNIHNNYCASDPFLMIDHLDDDDNHKSGDVYHFISYVPIDGKIYELDGIKGDPVIVGEYTDVNNWVELVKNEVIRRMDEYSNKENGFTLLGVVDNLKEKAEKRLSEEQLFVAALEQYSVTNVCTEGYKPTDFGETEEDRRNILAEHRVLYYYINR